MPPLSRQERLRRQPSAGVILPRNWFASHWRWPFSFSPSGLPVSGDLSGYFPIVHLSSLKLGDAPTFHR
jgi:hypothetical protein